MSEIMGYVPSEEEIMVAEESMTPEQKSMSIFRENYTALNELGEEEFERRLSEVTGRLVAKINEMGPKMREDAESRAKIDPYDKPSASYGDNLVHLGLVEGTLKDLSEGFTPAETHSLNFDNREHIGGFVWGKKTSESGYGYVQIFKPLLYWAIENLDPEDKEFIEMAKFKQNLEKSFEKYKKVRNSVQVLGLDPENPQVF